MKSGDLVTPGADEQRRRPHDMEEMQGGCRFAHFPQRLNRGRWWWGSWDDILSLWGQCRPAVGLCGHTKSPPGPCCAPTCQHPCRDVGSTHQGLEHHFRDSLHLGLLKQPWMMLYHKCPSRAYKVLKHCFNNYQFWHLYFVHQGNDSHTFHSGEDDLNTFVWDKYRQADIR